MEKKDFKLVKCQFKDVLLAVRVFGNGTKNLITFHGYGQDGSVFKKLSDVKTGHTIYSVDLFYHGQSSSPILEPHLSHQQFQEIFQQVINHFNLKKFALIGFSMGGKYVLSVLKSFPNCVTEVILLAPDGIKLNFWYTLGTKNKIFRNLFLYIVNNPYMFFGLVKLLTKAKVFDPHFTRFIVNEMRTLKQRKRVYNSWVYLRGFFVSKNDIISLITDNRIPFQIVIGKYDRVIKVQDVSSIIEKIPQSKLVILESGHSRFIQHYISTFGM